MKANIFCFICLLFFSSVKGYIQLNSNIRDGYLFPINSSYLDEIFNFTFRDNNCVQLVSDNSIIADRIRKALHSFPYLHGVSNNEGQCYNCVFIYSTAEVLNKFLRRPPVDIYRFLIIIINGNGKNLTHELLSEEITPYFYRLHGGMIDLETPNIFYQYDPRSYGFKKQQLSDIRKIQTEINSGNFGGRKLRVGTFNCTVNLQIGPLDDKGSPSWIGGAEMKLFDAVARKLNFTYEIVLPSDHGFNDSRIGLLHMLITTEKIDIALCGIWEGTTMRLPGILMTNPTHEICITYLVHRPLPLSQMGLGIFRSFEWKVWVLIFILIVIATIFLQVIAFVTAKMDGRSYYHLMKFMKPINNVLQLWSTLCGDAPDSLAIFGPLRHILVWWAIFSLLISTLFSSSIISNLTATSYRKPLDSIKDLVENNYYWSLVEFPAVFLYSSGLFQDKGLGDKWAERFKFNSEDSQCRIMQENITKIAILAVDYGYGVLLEEDLNCEYILDKYQTLPNCINSYRTAFFFPSGSLYIELFSDYITRYRESGLFNKEYKELFHEKILKENYIVDVQRPSNINKVDIMKLELSNTMVIFYIFSVGMIFSLLVFLLELLWYYKTCK